MVLAFKAKIYQYTGIYLAYREECEHVLSKECWDFICSDIDADLGSEDKQKLSIGLWQVRHGLHRPLWIPSLMHKNIFYQIVGFIVCFYRVAKYDIKKLFRRFYEYL